MKKNNNDILIGCKDILNYIRNLSGIEFSRTTFYRLNDKIQLIYVKANGKNIITTKKFAKNWISQVVIYDFFNESTNKIYKKNKCPLLAIQILNSIWNNDVEDNKPF